MKISELLKTRYAQRIYKNMAIMTAIFAPMLIFVFCYLDLFLFTIPEMVFVMVLIVVGFLSIFGTYVGFLLFFLANRKRYKLYNVFLKEPRILWLRRQGFVCSIVIKPDDAKERTIRTTALSPALSYLSTKFNSTHAKVLYNRRDNRSYIHSVEGDKLFYEANDKYK